MALRTSVDILTIIYRFFHNIHIDLYISPTVVVSKELKKPNSKVL